MYLFYWTRKPLRCDCTLSLFRSRTMNQPGIHDRSAGIGRLYTCERGGECAAGLRRFLGPSGPRLYELRSAAAVFEELDARPASVIVWQARLDSLDSLAEALHRQSRHYAASIGIVVGERRMARYEWQLRESGAVHAVFRMRHLHQVVRIALEHLAMIPSPPATWQDDIEQQLPWPMARSADFRLVD
jgi:hypothetical protein